MEINVLIYPVYRSKAPTTRRSLGSFTHEKGRRIEVAGR